MDDADADGTDRETILRLLAEDRLESAPLLQKDESMINDASMVPVRMLHARSWRNALSFASVQTIQRLIDDDSLRELVQRVDRFSAASDTHTPGAVDAVVDRLFDLGQGHLAVAWQMLRVRLEVPSSFIHVMPPLARLVDQHGDDEEREIMKVWWAAAAGNFADMRDSSIFSIANLVVHGKSPREQMRPLSSFMHTPIKPTRRPAPLENHVIVMPAAPADGKLPKAWLDLVGEPLPLVVARDVAGVRATLHREFPHATHVVDTLLRGCADGKPVRMTPTLLVGPPGSGKTLLARRVADSLGLYAFRQDAASAIDGTFGGSSKTWSTAQPSVPARAVLSSRQANPMVLVDEIEKAGSGSYNGRLWDSLIPYLEKETSSRTRESALDVEICLSHVMFIATANSTEALPGPLLDRFRIMRVPAPTLAHLPALAAQVMRDLAREDGRQHDAPLAGDELEVIGRAWAKEKFSMRKLQRLVAATLEVRDQLAPRH
ncbi:hypothetical protein SSBR45G_46300 [Bradyrhizobium sp. SSBR45G]|nr:hypothetical protein SSBR45G_46300 [Bradyrhizobium sp. SSBR45G]GLH87161.1 hypothetical protein SSBR45R_46210 [Bradyrhizobium sp. SSBR45R]